MWWSGSRRASTRSASPARGLTRCRHARARRRRAPAPPARPPPATRVAGLLVGMGAFVTAADSHVDPGYLAGQVRREAMTAATVWAADAVVILPDPDDA